MAKSTKRGPEDLAPIYTTKEYESLKTQGINPTNFSLIDNTGGGSIEAEKKPKKTEEKLYIPPVADMVTLRDLREATNKKVLELQILWQKADQKRKRDLAEAILNKTNLPEHYWQDEYNARLRYHAAIRFREILK